MTADHLANPSVVPTGSDKAITLALSLAQAEKAIHDFSAGQIDAIIDTDGNTHLLHPAQEHLRESNRRLQSIIDRVADAILVATRSGEIVFQSQAVERRLGYKSADLAGKCLFDLIRESDRHVFSRAFLNVIEGTEESATVQFDYLTHDGAYRWIEATFARLLEGDSANVVLSMRSLNTPRIPHVELPSVTATMAEPIKRAKDRFLAMIAHELRTPLMPVLLGIYEMQEDERFQEARPILVMMQRNLKAQTLLIEEMTDFALVGEHKVRLRLESLDVHEVIHFVLEICRSELTSARITANTFLGASQHVVMADSVRLQQVMWNLIRNAIKFSEPGSSIAIVTTASPPHHVTIEIADHGIGIAAALLPRLFVAFQQGSASEQRARGGLGLGLFIAKGLTEAQGGTLTALSAGRGKGAKFRITLPLAPPDGNLPLTELDSRFFHPGSHALPH